MSEKIWLKQYPQDIAAEVDIKAYSSLADLFEKSCAEFKDAPALSNLGSQLSFAELDLLSQHFAAYLQHELQLCLGDRVAIMLPNVMQYYVAMFGILRAGMIVVNVNPLYTALELSHQLADSGATTIIVMENFAHTVQKALPQTPLKHVIVTGIGDLLGGFKSHLVNFFVRHIKKLVPSYQLEHCIRFKQVMAIGKGHIFHKVILNHQNIAYLQYTGGTTGVPKAAILTHGNMLANVMQAITFVNAGSIINKGKDTVIVPLPLYHIFSLTVCALSFLRLGCKASLITNPRDLKAFIKELARTRYEVMVGINTLFNALMHRAEFRKLSFNSLKLVITGGAPVLKSVAVEWHKLTGVQILEGYGLTEASPIVTINPVNISHFTGSIGVPVPSTDVVIKDDNGYDLPVGQAGELCIKGPQVMQGYWNNAAETSKVFTEDGWLKSGDIAKFDEQGFLYLVDRKKDMILVSGFNVYPNEIEDVLTSHPGILETAVIGIANDLTGEAVKAFVVKKDPLLTAEQIIAFCREKLTGYKIPKDIEFVSELPKSNVGKVLRKELRK
ncbi:MAG TPA: AMP-binding protein [Gammaproteobacteria bacterium]|nr:AMP-binding protein [Gammaproteobacteria bacterium]